MITVKGVSHIRTSRNIKGFRSGKHATRLSLAYLNGARAAGETERLVLREARRIWLTD